MYHIKQIIRQLQRTGIAMSIIAWITCLWKHEFDLCTPSSIPMMRDLCESVSTHDRLFSLDLRTTDFLTTFLLAVPFGRYLAFH